MWRAGSWGKNGGGNAGRVSGLLKYFFRLCNVVFNS